MCITFLFISGQNNVSGDSLVPATSFNFDSLTSLSTGLILSSPLEFENTHVIPLKIWNKTKFALWKKEDKKLLWIRPAIAWNNYDKTQLGINFGGNFEKGLEFLFTPMIGTGSKNLTGLSSLNYSRNLNRLHLKNIKVNLQAQRFSYLLFPEDLTYNVVNPSLLFAMKSEYQQGYGLVLNHKSIWQEYILLGRKTQYFYLNNIQFYFYAHKENVALNLSLDLEQGDQFSLLKQKFKLSVPYTKKPGNAFTVNSFLGTFIYNVKSNTNIDAPLPIIQLSGTSNSGIYWLQKDYGFDDLYLDRNAQDNFLQRQTASSEGGFKSLTSLGNSNQFLMAVNLKSDVLFPSKLKKYINIQPYLNIAFSKNRNVKGSVFAEGGASILMFKEFLGFHIPFATTNNIKSNQASVYSISNGDWTKRITFSLDLLRLRKKAG